jgi:hypothetical protein
MLLLTCNDFRFHVKILQAHHVRLRATKIHFVCHSAHAFQRIVIVTIHSYKYGGREQTQALHPLGFSLFIEYKIESNLLDP